MVTSPRPVLAALALAAVLAACTGDGGQPIDGTTRPIGNDPLGDDEVTLHMAAPPELPAELGEAVVTAAELRAEDRTSREIVQLVDVPAAASTLAAMLPAGAVLRVAAGQSLEVGEDVDVAGLEPEAADGGPGTLRDVRTPCAAPCVVAGPGLIAPAGWMAGFGIADGWQLLVPAPGG